MGRISDIRLRVLSSASLLFAAAAAMPAWSAERVVYSYTAAEGPSLSNASGEAVFASRLFSSVTGQPRLPLVMKSILLPIDAEVGSVSARLVDVREEAVIGTYAVRPVPPMASGKGAVHWPKDRVFVDGKDIGVYKADAYYPEEKHISARVSQQGEWKFVDCAFAPYRYNPVTGKLVKVVAAEVEVTYARAPGFNSQSLPHRGKTLNRDYRKMGKGFVNYSEAKDSYLSAGAVEAGASPSEAQSFASGAPLQAAGLTVSGRYVILTTTAIQSGLSASGLTGLSAFVAQKQAQGFTVQVVTENAWGGGAGDVAANNIRQWLKANYLGLNIQYVLLIGDPRPLTGTVPMKSAYPWSTDLVPTDFFYSDLSGNWDANNNGRYGEDADRAIAGGPDAFAEVSVGRIPFYGSFAECDQILKRTVSYQNTSAAKALSRKMVLLPMVPLDPSTPSYQLGEQIRSAFVVPNNWKQHRIYDTALSDNGTMVPIPEVKAILPPVEMLGVSPRKVVTAWNTIAQGLTIWMTHGSGTGAAGILEYEHTGLLSDNAPGMVLHGSCSNSEPEVQNNLSFMLLKSGAIASIAGTRVSWYTPGWNDFPDQNSDGGIAYHFAKQVIQNGLPVSDAFNAVRATIVEPNWWNWIVFNTYGAPEITLATAYSGPRFDISRDRVDFGDVAVTDQAQTRTVVLENSGTTSVTLNSILSDNALFKISGVTVPGTLTAGQKATLSIRFAPNALGWFKGAVTVKTSLGDKVIHLTAGATPAGEFLQLTDFNWGSDILNGYYSWKKDTGPEGTPIQIGGKWYDRGLGGHSADGAEAYVTYNLKTMGKPIQTFYAEIGIDDRLTDPACGAATFKVYLDNALAYTSPLLNTASPLLPISVPVGAATTLKLALTDGGDGGCGDHGDWGNTRLYVVPSNTNANLSALSLSAGAITPVFASGTVAYSLSVANGVTSTTVKPTVAAATSSVKVKGATVASGSNSAAIALNVGANSIPVVVTAQSGAVKTYTVTVTRAGGTAIPLPGRMEAEAFKAGGEGVGYHDLTGGNNGNVYRTSENVDIEATADVGGGYNVAWVDPGEWLAYDVNVSTAGAYTLTARIASGVTGTKTVAVTVDGVSAGTFSTSDASGWQSWKNVALAGVNLTAGAHVIRLTFTSGGVRLNYVDVQPQGALPELLTNGNFSNGLTGWQSYFATAGLATITHEAGSARVTIANHGSYVYDIQLFQPVGLTAGKAYTLSFDVKAEATPKSFRALVEHNGSPWTVYQNVGYTVTAAANTYQRFELKWTQPATDAGARVTFDFGLTNTADAWVDNVSLK